MELSVLIYITGSIMVIATGFLLIIGAPKIAPILTLVTAGLCFFVYGPRLEDSEALAAEEHAKWVVFAKENCKVVERREGLSPETVYQCNDGIKYVKPGIQ